MLNLMKHLKTMELLIIFVFIQIKHKGLKVNYLKNY